MNAFSHVPPGFRFHPTDEELVDYYLRKKIAARKIDLDVIKEVDLYKIEPWDLQELCRIGSEEQSDWYFFSHKDKKYPTGTRTNRATKAGFWKATGRDKAIYLKHCLIGMRKTLVFYKGRAPNGQKSDWIMHEYRLETDENGAPQEEGWVVCRVFKKRLPTARRLGDDSLCWYDDQGGSFFPADMESPSRLSHPYTSYHHQVFQHQGQHYPCKQELEIAYSMNNNPHHRVDPLFLQLPQLESPKVPHAGAQSSTAGSIGAAAYGFDGHQNGSTSSAAQGHQEHGMQQQAYIHQQHTIDSYLMSCNNMNESNDEHMEDQVRDWRVLDKFVASQLSQDEQHAPKETNFTSNNNAAAEFALSCNHHDPVNIMIGNSGNGSEMLGNDYASTSTSSCCPIDLWK